MPRKSRVGAPEEFLHKIVDLLSNFKDLLNRADLRDQVLSLIPVHHNLRDLGSSLKGLNDAGSARDRILEYLKKYENHVVNGDELMVVSGISEYARRIRELRVELGWPILSGVTVKDQSADDQDQDGLDIEFSLPKMATDDYILIKIEQDKEAAFRWNVANEIRKKDSSVKSKILEYLIDNVGKNVTGEELRYVAGDKSEWARRTRELRTEDGWQVVTKATGKPELPIGVYSLLSDQQALEHDRHIPDRVRRIVLRRDGYQCTNPACRWKREEWMREDPRHLELHHKIKHEHRGENTEYNLITLCNICHDELHARENVK